MSFHNISLKIKGTELIFGDWYWTHRGILAIIYTQLYIFFWVIDTKSAEMQTTVADVLHVIITINDADISDSLVCWMLILNFYGRVDKWMTNDPLRQCTIGPIAQKQSNNIQCEESKWLNSYYWKQAVRLQNYSPVFRIQFSSDIDLNVSLLKSKNSGCFSVVTVQLDKLDRVVQ